jgi:cyclopropane fatty-acyl-phospholipid synthase-like methyltransferase
MDRDRVSAINHGDLPFHNPLDVARIDEALDLLGVGAGDRVLDAGCGPGELLVRIAQRTGAGGVGLDTSEIVIAEARRRAAARVPAVDLRFVIGDADALDEPDGRFAAACCLGSSHALGGLERALARLAAWVRPGGTVLLAEGFWARPPDPAYLAALGATADELPDFAELLRAGQAAGLDPVWVATSTPRDWEAYEWTLIANGDRFVTEHAGDPLTADVRAWMDRSRERLLTPGGTDTLGFALVVLRRPAT